MSDGRRERTEALGDLMPLSETAQRYAQAVFAAKIQELSHEHDREGSLLKAMVVNQTSLEARLASLKVNMLARQVRAKSDALQAAYEKDGKLTDRGVLDEIMGELEGHAAPA